MNAQSNQIVIDALIARLQAVEAILEARDLDDRAAREAALAEITLVWRKLNECNNEESHEPLTR